LNIEFESFQSSEVRRKNSKNCQISIFDFQCAAKKYRRVMKVSYFIYGLVAILAKEKQSKLKLKMHW
jgi:hypothetical protein